ncbi:electron transfer flavodomain protein [Mycobacterium avium MAV_061107_1842]|nr:electron transfer flavodomain protein [Mycobacterium avium MAV_061107_1842]
MTNIVVLIKQVPDTWSERKLTDGDWTLDREAADAVLDEINERAVEEALQIREREGGEGSVTVLTAGPERATEAIRKALSMGADKAVHLKDDGMHGSDVVQTGWALARALGTIEGTELVIAGNESTDGTGGRCPPSSPSTWACRSSPTCASCPSRTAKSPASGRPTTASSTWRPRCPRW